jgi:hypothetical protein
MESKTTRTEKVVVGVCIGVLVILSFTIVVRIVTRQILVMHFGMDNAFTEFVWFDNLSMASFDSGAEDTGNASSATIDTNWEKQYPFDSSKSNLDIPVKETSNGFWNEKIAAFTDAVTYIEERIESYGTERLVFYFKMVEEAYAYEQLIGWNFASFGEYNGVVELADGYLSEYVEKRDVTPNYEALFELNDFCQDNGINFLYVQTPYKISEYDDTDVSGLLDFSNQNANDLLAMLGASGIDYYDIRETIHENNIHNHDLFYKTDHHWLATAGLWASQNILSFCNDKYGWIAELSLLDSDQFDYVTYENWFLGSQGKKVTLARCQPDDFTLIYPKYETSFHYYVPAEGIDATGDYSIVYNMAQVKKCDYFNNSPYHAYNYGDQPLIQIENQLEADNHKILIIRDSFSDCVISCLALAEKNVDSLDIRYFTGSVKAYIEQSAPDLVIVMYNPSEISGEIDYSTHTDAFDFR